MQPARMKGGHGQATGQRKDRQIFTALGKKSWNHMTFPRICFFFGFSKRLSFTPVATDNGTAPRDKESRPEYFFVSEFERLLIVLVTQVNHGKAI